MLKIYLAFLLSFFLQLSVSGQEVRWVNHLTGGGGSHYVFDSEIGIDPNSVFYCGRYRATATFYGQNGANIVNPPFAGSRDIFFAKTDSLGQFIWVKTIGGADTDIAYGITLDEFGNIYVTGVFSASLNFDGFPLVSEGSSDVFVAKFDSDGNCIWVRTMGGAGLDTGTKVVCDRAGSIYVGGSQAGNFYFDSDSLIYDGYFVSKFDYDGNIGWVTGPENLTSASSALYGLKFYNNGVYFCGSMTGTIEVGGIPITSAGGWYDIMFAKLDTAGNVSWAYRVGSYTADEANDIAVNDSFIYVVGTYSGTVNFGSISVTSDQSVPGSTGALNSSDAFIAKYDSTGFCYWVREHKSLMFDEMNSVYEDHRGNLIVTGSYLQSPDPNLSTSVGEIRISSYSPDGDSLWTIASTGSNIGVGFTLVGDAVGNIYFGGAAKNNHYLGDFTIPGAASVYSGVMAKIFPPLSPLATQSAQSCSVDTVYYSVDVSGGPVSYDWYFGAQTLISNSGDSLTLLVDPSMTDSVSCIVSNGMETDTIFFSNPVFNFPVLELGANFQSCESSVLLNAGSDGLLYDWGGGQVLYDSLLTVSVSDTYTVTVVNAEDCQSTDSITIQFVDCAGISANDENSITVVFNPLLNSFVIQSPGANQDFVVFDLCGQEMMYKSGLNEVEILPAENLSAGLYFFVFFDSGTAKLTSIKCYKFE